MQENGKATCSDSSVSKNKVIPKSILTTGRFSSLFAIEVLFSYLKYVLNNFVNPAIV